MTKEEIIKQNVAISALPSCDPVLLVAHGTDLLMSIPLIHQPLDFLCFSHLKLKKGSLGAKINQW